MPAEKQEKTHPKAMRDKESGFGSGLLQGRGSCTPKIIENRRRSWEIALAAGGSVLGFGKN
jgi:hypothetical protein